ncbi:MAG: ribonuclease T2 [Dokdonella sp.]|uniref:ribonuclease T2 n=1 Tax=Dokdonella sp. TaxID=2291710 RepID=UPI003266E38E
MPRLLFVVLLASMTALLALPAHARHGSKSKGHAKSVEVAPAGPFDYYVMALSWSPTFCETHPDEDEQCGHKGYGFVLHGLWPQYESGSGPQRCDTDTRPDRRTIAATLPFMPSKRLINHEWSAHGACSGLDPAAYFGLADRAFASVRVPPELKAPAQDVQTQSSNLRDLLKRANPNLRDDMLSLHCSHGELVEVRVCLDKDLTLRSCGKRTRSGCPATAPFVIPASK